MNLEQNYVALVERLQYLFRVYPKPSFGGFFNDYLQRYDQYHQMFINTVSSSSLEKNRKVIVLRRIEIQLESLLRDTGVWQEMDVDPSQEEQDKLDGVNETLQVSGLSGFGGPPIYHTTYKGPLSSFRGTIKYGNEIIPPLPFNFRDETNENVIKRRKILNSEMSLSLVNGMGKRTKKSRKNKRSKIIRNYKKS